MNSIFIGANLLHAPQRDKLDGFPVQRISTPSGPRLRYLIFALIACAHLFQQRRSYDLALLHSTRPFTFLILFVLKCLRKPALLSLTLIGNDDPEALRRKSFLWKIEGKALRYFDRIICKSSALRDICLQEGFGARKLAAIPNGTNLSRFHPPHNSAEKARLRAKFGIPDKFVVALVGRIGIRKGCDLLFEAWEEVATQTREAELLLLGPHQSGRNFAVDSEAFQQRVQNYAAHAEDYLMRFIGETNHANVALYLRVADCLVFPSQREGLPNVVIEAMATGLPVICSNIPGVTTDLIEHDINGILLQTRAPHELRGAILRLQQDKNLRQRLGRNAARTAREKFDVSVIAKQHRQLYMSLL